ncbi:MAG: DUF86 domain-containing protein [Myxococcales bacterium]|nr:DUF86 domain-containing protein [Myxococcales bacterium]
MIRIDTDEISLVRSATARIQQLVSLVPDDPRVYLSDNATQDRVILHLILSIQACISVAAEIVANESLETDGGLGGLFDSLANAGIITSALVVPLQMATKLRNRILFDFENININEVYDAACTASEVLVEFLVQVRMR